MELSHRTLSQSGPYKGLTLDKLPQDVPLALYRQMLRLRRTEEALLAEYHPAEEMRCPIHFCIGQEAIPASLSALVKPDDYMFSHHRSHGYYFAKGAPLRELFAEIYGRETGADGGRAGSQDISHSGSHFYSGAILAGAVSIAVGAAFGFRLAWAFARMEYTYPSEMFSPSALARFTTSAPGVDAGRLFTNAVFDIGGFLGDAVFFLRGIC